MVISSTLEKSPWVSHTETTLLPYFPTLKLHFNNLSIIAILSMENI